MFLVCSVCLFFIIMVVLLLWKKNTEYYPSSSSCIITMTTFMSFENRFQTISTILDPLVKTGQELVVINEWCEDPSRYIDFMKRNYPQIQFIQKSKDDKGQARSLNILVRDYLLHSSKKYWIHWEDTWECSQSFYPKVMDLMEKYPEVSQLQITNDWQNVNNKKDLGEIEIILPQHDYKKNVYEVKQIELSEWPLFSLRPSINRLSFFQKHSTDFYFLEDPYLWPLWFEWEFGRIFLRNKGVKAITKKSFAKRLETYKSTYHK